MVGPGAFINGSDQALQIIPPEIASQILLIVQALGGLFIVYLIFLGMRLYWQKKQLRMIREMNKDIKIIIKKLNIEDKR